MANHNGPNRHDGGNCSYGVTKQTDTEDYKEHEGCDAGNDQVTHLASANGDQRAGGR